MSDPRVFSITPGEELVEALGRAAAGLEGWLQASGVIEAVELRVAGEGADPVRALRGRFTLAALGGPAGGPYGVTLARATDAGLDVVAGELVRARSLGVTALVLASAETTAARPRREEQTTVPGAAAGSSPNAAAAPAAQPGGSAWAAQALEAARARRIPFDEQHDPVLPVPGDLVQHFAFGLCEVLTAEDERLKIRDLQGPGRIREIRLEMLTVQGPHDREGKRLFRLERRS